MTLRDAVVREHRLPRRRRAPGRWGALASACAAILLLGAFGAPTASANAKRGLETGFADWAYTGFNSEGPGAEGARAAAFGEARAAGAGLVRIHLDWPKLAPEKPRNPRNSNDPAYNRERFERLDDQVREAQARGLQVLIIVVHAPSWAEGPGRPNVSEEAPAGTWKPQPGPARDFGEAIARRYSGSFQNLPRVRHFQIFNEPNIRLNLTPQWEGDRPTSALVYRGVLNAFYNGVKSVHGRNVVVTAGTAPYGTEPNRSRPRMRPLAFWRTVMCLRPNLQRAECPQPARFDVLAHQPINTTGGPFQGAAHRDDISSPDMWKLRRALRAAERLGTIGSAGRHPLWATEFWWEVDPPGRPRITLRTQARWIQESLYLFWRDGASLALNFRVRDGTQEGTHARNTTGVYRANGTKKPAFRAFRFPFVALKRGRRVELWGKAPARGRVVVQRRRGGKWRRVTRVRSGKNRVFRTRVRMRGKPVLRAQVRGGGRSLSYEVR